VRHAIAVGIVAGKCAGQRHVGQEDAGFLVIEAGISEGPVDGLGVGAGAAEQQRTSGQQGLHGDLA